MWCENFRQTEEQVQIAGEGGSIVIMDEWKVRPTKRKSREDDVRELWRSSHGPNHPELWRPWTGIFLHISSSFFVGRIAMIRSVPKKIHLAAAMSMG